jgi:hypothetical protein
MPRGLAPTSMLTDAWGNNDKGRPLLPRNLRDGPW